MTSPIDSTNPAAPVAAPAVSAPLPPAGAAQPASASPEISFHDVLSALNPLQYLPVLGPIYRAITGDTIAEPLRILGSMVASGLMGGPIGVMINVAGTVAQKLTGIDIDKLAHDVLAGLGVIEDDKPAAALTASPQAVPAAGSVAPAAGWTTTVRMAYGAAASPVPTGADAPRPDSAGAGSTGVGSTGVADAVARGLALAAYGRTMLTCGPMIGSG